MFSHTPVTHYERARKRGTEQSNSMRGVQCLSRFWDKAANESNQVPRQELLPKGDQIAQAAVRKDMHTSCWQATYGAAPSCQPTEDRYTVHGTGFHALCGLRAAHQTDSLKPQHGCSAIMRWHRCLIENQVPLPAGEKKGFPIPLHYCSTASRERRMGNSVSTSTFSRPAARAISASTTC